MFPLYKEYYHERHLNKNISEVHYETEFFELLKRKKFIEIDESFFAKDEFLSLFDEFPQESHYSNHNFMKDLLDFFEWCADHDQVQKNSSSRKNLLEIISKLNSYTETEKFENFHSVIKVKQKNTKINK